MVAFGDGKKLSQRRVEGPSFGEIVGQEEYKRALLAIAADDGIDGLLVRGEKGTAKSTAVRALADLLGDQRAVADCPYGCPPADPGRQCAACRGRDEPPVEHRPVPFVTLPLGATRDRVVGTLSVGDALEGNKNFEPGLLASANRGLLYVDEVNLLDDHLVDVLLDAAASGVNTVERDGVSVSHPADFTLIGTMNPEEGDLRPQLRDRFALQATVTGCEDLDDRVAIIERAIHDEPSATGESTAEYRRRLRGAVELLADVELPTEYVTEIAALCRDAGVDGHRGDIATARAARVLAALDGRRAVIETDVRRAAALALPHRLASRPFEDAPDPSDVIDEHFEDGESADDEARCDDATDRHGDARAEGRDESADPADGEDEPASSGDGDPAPAESGTKPASQNCEDGDAPSSPRDGEGEPPAGAADADGGDGAAADGTRDETDDGDNRGPGCGDEPEEGTDARPLVPGQERAAVGDTARPDMPHSADVGSPADGGGRVRASPSVDNDGPRVRTRRADDGGGVDPAASVRAAARRGGKRVERRDLRQSVRAGEASTLVLFVVDASASMRPAMRTAKGTVLELLRDAYQQRDVVGFVAVAGERADVVLPPTDSASHAARHLKDLPTGDRTPLPDGLRTAGEVLDRAEPDACVVVLVTDGRANVADGSPTVRTREAASALAERDASVLVVDAGDGDRADLLDDVVAATDGRRIPLAALSAHRVDAAAGTSTATEL